MTQEEFDLMEVKPGKQGHYQVTMFQFKKEEQEDPDYIKEWLEYDGENWDYAGYKDCCYVCFIHARDE